MSQRNFEDGVRVGVRVRNRQRKRCGAIFPYVCCCVQRAEGDRLKNSVCSDITPELPVQHLPKTYVVQELVVSEFKTTDPPGQAQAREQFEAAPIPG